MKKPILTALLLCALLLGGAGGAWAAAGGGDDPLISLSYVDNTFLPNLAQRLRRLTEQSVAAYLAGQTAAGQGMKSVTLAPGDSLELSAGQQFTLLSGAAILRVDAGSVINATAGRPSTGGAVRAANRYIVCGASAATVTASESTRLAASAGVVAGGDNPFGDVSRSDWFFADVTGAYRRGLVNGMSAGVYAPGETLTAAQAIKLAACMHQLYHTGAVSLQNAADGRAWYMSYVDYALKNGILTAQPANYNAALTRAEFLRIFYNALPEREYARKNLIMDGAIPDVATDAPLAKQVYTFYAAGILTGYAAGGPYLAHAFGPETTVTRAEVAVIMNRMFTPSARVSFTMD